MDYSLRPGEPTPPLFAPKAQLLFHLIDGRSHPLTLIAGDHWLKHDGSAWTVMRMRPRQRKRWRHCWLRLVVSLSGGAHREFPHSFTVSPGLKDRGRVSKGAPIFRVRESKGLEQ
jgi:hypothetical protein